MAADNDAMDTKEFVRNNGNQHDAIAIRETGEPDDEKLKMKKKVYIPGISRKLKEKEELVCDKNAYKLLKTFQCENPCLSFDIVPNMFEGMQDGFPVSSTIVAGTQAENVRHNAIVLMTLSNLHARTQNPDDEENGSSSSESEDEPETGTSVVVNKKALMLSAKIPHHGGVNRIRVTRISTATVCASWNDQGKVQLWNLENCLKAVDELGDGKQKQSSVLKNEKPLFSFVEQQNKSRAQEANEKARQKRGFGYQITPENVAPLSREIGHSEGFALDWSSITPGKLASGDNRSRIHVWNMGEGGQWSVDQRPYTGHSSSVEDIQWSPSEESLFASCSSDSTIRLWDGRISPAQACVCTVEKAHDSDVNVISWNRKDPFLLSGGDDAAVKIWDLKTIQYKQAVAVFKHHTKPVTSVSWYPHDSTVFGVSGEDDQVTIWDLALEADQVAQESASDDDPRVPPQLLFVHAGQKAIKEIRWHPQTVGILTTTAQDGFNILRTVNM